MKAYFWLLVFFGVIHNGCMAQEHRTSGLLGNDVRLYQGSIAWDIAQAVRHQETRGCLQLGWTFGHEQRPQCVDRYAEGPAFPAFTWASTVAGHDGPRYAAVCRGRALAGPVRRIMARLAGRTVRALAHSIRPVSTLVPSRSVGAGAGSGAKRDGLAPAHGRFDGRTCAPSGRRREKKDSPVGQALGRSRGRTR